MNEKLSNWELGGTPLKYNHLFSTGKIGNLTLKNRIVMPPMGTNLSDPDGEITDRQIRYYEERAKGGVGLIVVEVASIDYEYGKASITQPRVDDDRFIPGIQKLAKAVQQHGAKIFMQLHHAGRQSKSILIGGKQIVAPSPVTCPSIGEEPRELTTEEVKELVYKHIMGAYRSKLAGVDGVEIHAAHGYLVNQFLSPYTNLRNDEYGGTFKNRMRFIEEIIIGIKEKCGSDFPVSVRLSVDEFVEGGIDQDLGKDICLYLEKVGADAIHASVGTYDSSDKIVESPLYPQGWRVYLAEEIKKQMSIPVITVGVIREPEFAESVIAEGRADFVALGRGHIADPEWANKARDDREDEIRKCISCLHCIKSVGQGLPIQCATNVRAGREIEFEEMTAIEEKRHVVVIGGGPGGMEAARVLALRGYQVTLYEKGNRLGGQLHLVNKPLHKEKMNWFITYLSNEMKRLKVDVRMETEASIEEIKAINPYAVFIATGAKGYVPVKIKGHDLPNVYGYEDVLLEQIPFKNKKIAVIGSGMVCYSATSQLAAGGNDVTWIDIPTETGNKITLPTQRMLANRLRNADVLIIKDHKLAEIKSNAVMIEDEAAGTQKEILVDQVVISMGTESFNPLEESYRQHFDNVFVIGDAENPSSLTHAVKGAFEIAHVL